MGMRLALLAMLPVAVFVNLLRQDPADTAQMLKQAQQLARTYEPHQRLQQLVGTFDVVVRNSPPGGTASSDRGSVVGKAILGGRYVVLNFQLQVQGHAVEGVLILGFDNLHQRYTASWRDDLSTWAVDCAGAPDVAAPQQLRLQGELADARDPDGRAFRLEVDLPSPAAAAKDLAAQRVQVRLLDTVGGSLTAVQQQEWTRR